MTFWTLCSLRAWGRGAGIIFKIAVVQTSTPFFIRLCLFIRILFNEVKKICWNIAGGGGGGERKVFNYCGLMAKKNSPINTHLKGHAQATMFATAKQHIMYMIEGLLLDMLYMLIIMPVNSQ